MVVNVCFSPSLSLAFGDFTSSLHLACMQLVRSSFCWRRFDLLTIYMCSTP
ncbi:hypothetical protein MANES_09G028751v8 [Manihot esculenta]|uniref:Uncharacterized protein n=2 Tax=Manihot esculenta TaxID=3983 RepID=A0ACB7H2K2_MANES|nr:hypothetical protein MANES_09G028751v8 [Manihot esculenta]KAG8646792.1 hypothetical protein MANES_09G028751v8 [Manihot esculenta]